MWIIREESRGMRVWIIQSSRRKEIDVTQYRLAILDDYQQVSSDYAPWDSLLDDGVKVTVFSAPFV